RQDKSVTIYSINRCGDHPASVFANAQSKPRQLLAGFCLARKLCFLVLRKTFLRDCSRFDTDSIVGGGQPFHQPAVAPVGSPGSMPGGVSSMRSLLVSGCIR